MKYLYLLLILCISSIALYGEEECDNGYDIYLLIGQSNMAGRATMLPSDTTDIVTGVFLLNDKGIPEPAKAPLNRYSTIRKGMKMQQIGPGTSVRENHARKKRTQDTACRQRERGQLDYVMDSRKQCRRIP